MCVCVCVYFSLARSHTNPLLQFMHSYEQSQAAQKKSYDQLCAAMQTPWSLADVEAEKKAAEDEVKTETEEEVVHASRVPFLAPFHSKNQVAK